MPDIPKRRSPEIDSKFIVSNNTFSRDVKSDPKDRLSVEIGDSKDPDFKPQAKFQRWDNEINASFRAPEDPLATVETVGELIKYVAPDGYEVHQYDKPDASEDGGFEIELHFADIAALVKRATVVGDNYRIALTTQFKNVVGYKQSSLTQQEIDEGANRPENVINSIAFYHSSKGGMNRADGMEYKTGKALHSYRIKLIDADENEMWGDQNWLPESNELELLLPKGWVDSCVFPLIVDPTLGYTSLGASSSSGLADFANSFSDRSVRVGMPFTLPENGTLSSITAGLVHGSTSNVMDIAFFANSEDSIDNTHDEIAKITGNETITTTAAWFSLNASSQSLSSGEIILNVVGDGEDATAVNRVVYDDTASHNIYTEIFSGAGSFASSQENPWSDTPTSATPLFSIYATYTAESTTTSTTTSTSSSTSSSTTTTSTSSSTTTTSTSTSTSTSSSTTTTSTSTSSSTSSSTTTTSTSTSTSTTTTSTSTSTSSSTSTSTSTTTTIPRTFNIEKMAVQ